MDVKNSELRDKAQRKVNTGVQKALRLVGELRGLGFESKVETTPTGFSLVAESKDAKEALKSVKTPPPIKKSKKSEKPE